MVRQVFETTAEPSSTREDRWQPRKARPPAILIIPALLVSALTLSPIAYLLLREGLSVQRFLHEISSPTTSNLILHSALLAFSVTFVCAILGIGLALLVVRTDLPYRRVWTVLFALPLGIPAFVSSYTWVAASYQLAPQATFLYGLRGAVLVLSLAVYPYIYLPVVAALRDLDPAQEEVARALGAGAVEAFLRVTLPQLRVAIASGGLIIALHMLAEFGALELLRYPTLTTAIVQRVTVLSAPEAARTLSTVLAIGALLFLASDRLLRGRPTAVRTGSGVARRSEPWRLGYATPVWLIFSGTFIAIALGVPLFSMIAGMARVIGNSGAGVSWGELLEAAVNTGRYALVTAVVATVAAFPVSMLSVRYPGRLATLVERSTWIAHALPGVVMSLALVYLSVRWLYPLYQTSSLLIAGYVILFVPIAIGAQHVGVAHAAPHYDQISRSLGLGPLATLFRVTLPLAFPGIAAGAMLVFLNVGKELTMTLLLHPTGKRTLSTALWNTTNGEVLDFSTAAPYAIALVVITAIPAWVLVRHSLNPPRRPGE
ncbi:MAG: iron ABC transporter permease [Thermomicrobiales bacterium]